MSGQKINKNSLGSIINDEQYQYRSEWEKVSHEKILAMYKILSGLNVWQARKILERLSAKIETNSILS